MRKRNKSLSRRSFLRGAGGAAVGLPFLSSLGACNRKSTPESEQVSQGLDNAPTRLLIFFSPNGSIRNNWRPTGGENDWELSQILQPLADYKEKLLVLDGIDMRSTHSGPGDAHQKGMGHILTGTALQEGDLFTGGGGELAGWGGGISIDQRVAQVIGQEHKFGSLEFGVQVGSPNIWSRMSYAGPGQPVPPENNPYANYSRIFSDLGADPNMLQAQIAKRATVLDAVSEDFGRLQSSLSVQDQQHLERHASSIRDLEQRLSNFAEQGALCEEPDLGEPIDFMARENYPEVGRLQMDLAAMALTCNLTRVASIQFSNAVGNHVHSWLGLNRGHHDFSHEGDGIASAQEALTSINHWYAQQFAYLLGKLDAVPEGDGTMLDNTLVVWVNELGKGNSHSRDDLPLVLAGSAGGHFRTGRYLSYFSTSHNDLLVSIQNAFGINEQSFGDPSYCTGAISNLT